MKQAIIYIASGEQYIKEVARSAASVTSYPTFLCTPDITDKPIIFDNFDYTLFLPTVKTKYWYLSLTHYLNIVFEQLYSEIEQILLFDTDTYICGDLSDFFTALKRFDIVGTHAVGRETMVKRDDIPASFPELHIGAMAFNRNGAVKHLFKRWLKIYQDNPDYYGDNDQGPLREALWLQEDIKLGILPQEFCFRYRWGGLITGQVRVLHGRENNTPYEQIAKEVNSSHKPRVYHRRELA